MQYYTPENYRFGGGSGASTFHPLALTILFVTAALILLLPRKYVVIAFIAGVILIPFGQQLYIAGLHLYADRLLIVFGWIRLFSARKNLALVGGFNSIDKVFALWAIFRATATCLLFLEAGAVVNAVAFLWDTLGGYFLLRFLVRDQEDAVRLTKALAFIVILLGITMSNEHASGSNVFGYIGGRFVPTLRDGKLRASGPFVGPIPAGTFGATLSCLFLWLWRSRRGVGLGIAALVGAAAMVVSSASSTPLMTVPAGLLAIGFWPLRKNMRAVRWGLVAVLVSLQLVMKAPVWFLINHIDLVGGNSSYHRAMLVDGFIRHFSDWWLVGVESTGNWGYDMWDQANQFVSEGEKGGLASFICFVVLVSREFGRLGTACRLAVRRKVQWTFWLFGAALFAFVVSFFGISFSDQSIWGWFAFLALIAAVTEDMSSTPGNQEMHGGR